MALPLKRQRKRRYQANINRVRRRFTTRSGKTVTMRLLQPDDIDLMLELFHRLSPESRRHRFHTNTEGLSETVLLDGAQQLAAVDNLTHGGAVIALFEEEDGREHLIGSARLARLEGEPASPIAEAAIIVRDDFHGEGVGTELLRRMVLLAKQMQIETMMAIFEADNDKAISLFRGLGLPTEIEISHGETTLWMTVPRSGSTEA